METQELIQSAFTFDIISGLTSYPKYLPSKYFYDEEGDWIFQEITKLDEYYLTRCEFEILETYKNEISHWVSDHHNEIQFIEFGAGDGHKTEILLTDFLRKGIHFTYSPVDISNSVLTELTHKLSEKYKNLSIEKLHLEYFQAIQYLSTFKDKKKFLLMLGSNIGNLTHTEMLDFFYKIADRLNPGDLLMLGFDLKKDPQVIINAYNDSKGITRDFNLNLLQRINLELDANFQLHNFFHNPIYHPETGEALSYLVSKKDQEISLDALETKIRFHKWETIFTEVSKKFTLKEIEGLAFNSGFEMVAQYFDKKNYYTNVIWKRTK